MNDNQYYLAYIRKTRHACREVPSRELGVTKLETFCGAKITTAPLRKEDLSQCECQKCLNAIAREGATK